MIIIAGQELATKDRPANLADQVSAATGLGLSEVPSHLAINTIAGVVAALLIPWLVEPVEPAELAKLIEDGNRPAIVAAVTQLYAPPVASSDQVIE